MNAEIKRRWMVALRSGEYEQGRGYLHDQEYNTYCCLGVLCLIAEEEGVTKKEIRRNSRGACWDGASTVLPESVMYWAGLLDEDPVVVWGNGDSSLSMLNDNAHLDFTEIADIIAEQL